jgi:hypothetical protein
MIRLPNNKSKMKKIVQGIQRKEEEEEMGHK